ncbi:hypothetical protein H0X06_06575 [Candidatus Dependentiae bacterium]|nr:hypothetical protein [Candidatus Dependentiae bacterium]
MNIPKKSVLLALMSVFCLSVKAESSSKSNKLYRNTTMCFITTATMVTTIHHVILNLHKKPQIPFRFGLLSIACGYAAYRSGLSVYSSYKKTCTSKKSLKANCDNRVAQETDNF